MQYRRVDDDTIQCIVSVEDMNERGLTLSDLLSRPDVAEGFLKELIEEAHEEIGYELTGANLSLQITPTQDEGMIITITNDDNAGMRGFIEHLRNIMGAIFGGAMSEMYEGIEAAGDVAALPDNSAFIDPDQPEDIRVLEFDSMNSVLDFAQHAFATGQLKSMLGYADERYYLVITKNRCSWKNFNRLSAMAFDYATVCTDIKGRLVYLSEHGESLIESGALGKLKKIADPEN